MSYIHVSHTLGEEKTRERANESRTILFSCRCAKNAQGGEEKRGGGRDVLLSVRERERGGERSRAMRFFLFTAAGE